MIINVRYTLNIIILFSYTYMYMLVIVTLEMLFVARTDGQTTVVSTVCPYVLLQASYPL